MDTNGGKRRGGGGGVMNWEIGIDMYTLMCIKWITNKNLLYKKIKKIKKKKKEKKNEKKKMGTINSTYIDQTRKDFSGHLDWEHP